ncbi:hypothetical protein FACS1894103_2390 [Campylobacterota bacterium]|nr:hypothetical protein FACS1894103_2390 [Campylobacterota bacterium]
MIKDKKLEVFEMTALLILGGGMIIVGIITILVDRIGISNEHGTPTGAL